MAKCARFEFGLGVMLANVLTHKEAVQTVDIPLVARILNATFSRALTTPPVCLSDPTPTAPEVTTLSAGEVAALPAPVGRPSLPKRGLESVALQLIFDLGKAAVGAMERRVVLEFIKAGVFDTLFQHLTANFARIDPVDFAAGVEGLSLLIATEEFATVKVCVTAPDFAVCLQPFRAHTQQSEPRAEG